MKFKKAFLLTGVLSMALAMGPNVSAEEVNVKEVPEFKVNFSNAYFNKELLKYATQDEINFYQDFYNTNSNNFTIQPGINSLATLDSLYLSYNEYFSKVEWITRNGVVSLSITPKSSLTSVSGNVQMARAFHSFSLLKEKFGSDKRWKNADSLSAQYHCHVLYAGSVKTPWNIEPHRTESGIWKVIKGKCNPA
ncbi:DUF2599 domain-containing protein [Bacillus thuringiensis]|uniref:DUF2599 domain-containing protein n=1 Tax=Bacillus thuringiensis TaxID=1428 RepID=UPI002FBE91D2